MEKLVQILKMAAKIFFCDIYIYFFFFQVSTEMFLIITPAAELGETLATSEKSLPQIE